MCLEDTEFLTFVITPNYLLSLLLFTQPENVSTSWWPHTTLIHVELISTKTNEALSAIVCHRAAE